MWIFLNNAMLSIVEERGNKALLRVRARLDGDIERVLPLAEVFEPEGSDYRFHAVVQRSYVELVMAEAVRKIDYPDFKSSVRNRKRHDNYARVWGVMRNAQEEQRHG